MSPPKAASLFFKEEKKGSWHPKRLFELFGFNPLSKQIKPLFEMKVAVYSCKCIVFTPLFKDK
jgi:hypothetical protein